MASCALARLLSNANARQARPANVIQPFLVIMRPAT
jgi:hypothetical protein